MLADLDLLLIAVFCAAEVTCGYSRSVRRGNREVS
jgi:hypothetical protein